MFSTLVSEPSRSLTRSVRFEIYSRPSSVYDAGFEIFQIHFGKNQIGGTLPRSKACLFFIRFSADVVFVCAVSDCYEQAWHASENNIL